MEQYFMPIELNFKHLRHCLDRYTANSILIRDCGGYNEDGSIRFTGKDKVRESLDGRVLDFMRHKGKTIFTIDKAEVFCFPTTELRDGKGLSVTYERFYPANEAHPHGSLVMLQCGIDPYDARLPEPENSLLKTVWDRHFLEISFKGRIPLEFHSWWHKPDFKYWKIPGVR